MNITLPNAIIWPDMLQGSPEWKAARKGRATASQFKKILTPTGKLSKSAEAYARQLARETVFDDPFEFAGNKATEWGNTHEPLAREAFSQWAGANVIEVPFATHKDFPVLGCSPDGLIVEPDGVNCGLEIKCPAPDTFVEWALAGGVPAEHMAQVHGSMIVTGLKRWEFVAYFPGAPLFWACVEWDEYTDKLKEALMEFVAMYSEIRPKVLKVLTEFKEP